jgi:FixJ family two-component response regulator
MTKNPSMIDVINEDSSVQKALGRFLRSANLETGTFLCAEEFLSSSKQKDTLASLLIYECPVQTV